MLHSHSAVQILSKIQHWTAGPEEDSCNLEGQLISTERCLQAEYLNDYELA